MKPKLFLNVNAGVNVFMHGIPFILGFVSIIVYPLFRKYGKRLCIKKNMDINSDPREKYK